MNKPKRRTEGLESKMLYRVGSDLTMSLGIDGQNNSPIAEVG
jgi:hypothetical protein